MMRNFLTDQSGGVTVIAAVGIFVFLGLVGLALDIAHMVVVKSELQKAADAGALAGARGLWPPGRAVLNNTADCSAGSTWYTWATNTTQNNQVDGVALADGEVVAQSGRYDYATKTFTAGCTGTTNAVQVTTQKSNINLFFAKMLGISSKTQSTSAIAVMDFPKSVGKGTMPIAVSKVSTQAGQEVYIGYNPGPEDQGGWFADPPDTANAATFRDYIVNDSCPPLSVGDTILLQNGVVSSALEALETELALHPGGWNTFLPVVDAPKFNQSDTIMGFVPFRITEVNNTGNPKYVKGVVLDGGEVATGLPGGGDNYGALAPPKAVK